MPSHDVMGLRSGRRAALLLAWSAAVRAQEPHSSAYRCCVNDHLRFGLPMFNSPPVHLYDATTGQFFGYTVKLIEMMAAETGMSYEIIGVDYQHPFTTDASGVMMSVSPSSLIASNQVDVELTLTSFDLPILNRTSAFGWAHGPPNYTTTDAFFKSYTTGVAYKTKVAKSAFALFEPFAASMWSALLVSAALYAALLVVLSGSLRRTTPARLAANASTSGYHVLAACFGGEDYEWITSEMRLLRISLLAMVLVSGSTYTANLAAFFNRPSMITYGPTTMNELKTSVACTDPYMAYNVPPYVGSVIYPDSYTGPPQDSYTYYDDYCLAAIARGDADVWLQSNVLVHMSHLSQCSNTSVLSFVNILPQDMGFLMRTADARLVEHFNTVINFIFARPMGVLLKETEFRSGQTCPPDSLLSDGDTTPVDFASMAGLFYLCGIVALLALALAAARWLGSVCSPEATSQASSQLDHTATEGEMLRDLLSRMDKLQSEIASAQASPAAGSAAPSVDDAQFAGLLRTLSSDRGGGGVRITRRRVKKGEKSEGIKKEGSLSEGDLSEATEPSETAEAAAAGGAAAEVSPPAWATVVRVDGKAAAAAKAVKFDSFNGQTRTSPRELPRRISGQEAASVVSVTVPDAPRSAADFA